LPTSAIASPPLPGSEAAARFIADLRLASPDFRALLAHYGDPVPALRRHGLVQWQAGRLSDAIASFRAALALKAENADLWRDLAAVHDGAGDMTAAVAYIRTSLNHDHTHARSWFLLASLLHRSGRADEAEAAFGRALLLDPALGDAHYGLGLLLFGQLRLPAAAASFEQAIAHGHATALGFATLGHVQYLAGRFADCARAFEGAMRFGPLDRNARRKYARARTALTIIKGDVAGAVADYPRLAGEEPEALDDVLRDAFAQLAAYGHPQAALALGRFRLQRNPDDAVQRYLIDALAGAPLDRAPLDYLERHFDRFASTFDRQLVEVLRYDAPAAMTRLLAGYRTKFRTILDLGCGTGLAAAHLASLGARIIGVDISGRMLEEAAKRQVYAELVKAEAIDFLIGRPAAFDLVFAADVLIYFGDLAPLFAAAARALSPGGIFACSVETAEVESYRVRSTGRFVHAPAYLESMAARLFKILAKEKAVLRLEAGRPAEGFYLLFERRPS
jgi:predicted TPR repeat methyltransferase